MRCEELHALLDRYLDGGLTDAERAQAEEHLLTCPSCRLALQVRRDSRTLEEDGEVPAAFSESWRLAIRREEAAQPGTSWNGLLRLLSVAAAFILVVGGTLLAGEQRRNWTAQTAVPPPMAVPEAAGAMEYSAFDAAPATEDQGTFAMRAAPAPKAQPQLARSAAFSIQTDDFDLDYAELAQALETLGGRTELETLAVSDDGLRTATLDARIPAENLDELTGRLQSIGTRLSYSESSEDLTQAFAQAQSRLDAPQAEAAGTAALSEELLALESRVTEPAVTITLAEAPAAPVIPDVPLDARVMDGLRAVWGWAAPTISDFLVFLAVALPAIAVLALAAAIITLIYKRRKHP